MLHLFYLVFQTDGIPSLPRVLNKESGYSDIVTTSEVVQVRHSTNRRRYKSSKHQSVSVLLALRDLGKDPCLPGSDPDLLEKMLSELHSFSIVRVRGKEASRKGTFSDTVNRPRRE
jgi:hypothetical protein